MEVRSLSTWSLGKGPCGPSCSSPSSLQQQTDRSTLTSSDNTAFGSWTVKDCGGRCSSNTFRDITNDVNNKVTGSVMNVNDQWEQELAVFEIEVEESNDFEIR